MNITINGDIYITAYGQTLDEIVGDNEDLDLPLDFLDDEDDYCEEGCDNCDCEDCEFYEEEDEEDGEESDIDDIVDELTTIYADILSEEICLCSQCVKLILIDYTKDFISCL